MPDNELMLNLGLYLRSSIFAKLLFLNEAYELIVDQPGNILEFGCWWGQNLVSFENLRAIHEPFNQSRRVIGFDSFSGYGETSSMDGGNSVIDKGSYSLPEGYSNYLKELMDFHEEDHVMGHNKKHDIIVGDVRQTVPQFFEDHPGQMVALAYFDLAQYEPTKICLEAVMPHLMPGSVLVMDELNSRDYPGETVAFKEVFQSYRYRLRKSRFFTDRTFVILQ